MLITSAACSGSDDDDSSASPTQAGPTDTQPSGGTATQPPATATRAVETPEETAPQRTPTEADQPTARPDTPEPGTPTAPQGPTSVTDEASVPLGGVTSVSLNNAFGDVTLKGSARRPTATISWNVQLEPPVSAALVEQITVSAAVEGGTTLVVAASVPEALEGKVTTFDVEVEVPPTLLFAVTDLGGDVTVEDMDAGGEIVSGAGAVTGSRLSGSPLAVTSDAGAVDLQTEVAASGSYAVDAGQGGVTWRIPNNSSATISATTSSGAVRFLNLSFTGSNVQGTANGSVGSGGSPAAIHTTTGAGDITFVGTATLPQPTPTPGDETPPAITPTPGEPGTPGEPTPTSASPADTVFTGNAQATVGAATSFTVDNPYGATIVHGLGSSPLITASFRMVLSSSAPASVTDQLDITIAKSGSNIVVTPVVPSQLNGQIGAYRITINTPAGLGWNLTNLGDIEVDAMSGSGAATSSAGQISAEGLTGSFDLQGIGGPVDASASFGPGQQIQISTQAQPISLHLPTSAAGTLAATTGEPGTVSIQGIPFDGTTGAQSVSGTLGAGGTASATLQSQTGDISILGQ